MLRLRLVVLLFCFCSIAKANTTQSINSQKDLEILSIAIEKVPNNNAILDRVFHDKRNRFTINYSGAWKQSHDFPEPTLAIEAPMSRIMVNGFDADNDINAIVLSVKKSMSKAAGNDIKFLNEGPTTIKAIDNSNLKAYYIIAVYSKNAVSFENLYVIVKRQSQPNYLMFIYTSAISQKKNTLPVVKAMLKSWAIEP